MDAKSLLPRFALLRRHDAFPPVVAFLALVLVLLVSMHFSNRPPVIESISPDVGYPGTVLLIRGSFFGARRGSSEVLIAGVRPSISSYLEWTDRRISVRVPDEVDSGFVFVAKGGERSNGKLFTNRNTIPVVLSGQAQPGQPFLQGISPSSGTVGTLIALKGQGFGATRAQSRVYFTPISAAGAGSGEASGDSGAAGVQQERFAGCECDFGYVNWSDTEIDLYVPDGAASGNVTVQTEAGTSNAQYFEVASPVGSETFTDKRGYQIRYGMQIGSVDADPDGTIDVWMPALADNLEQRNVQKVLDPQPLREDPRGIMRYRFEQMNPSSTYSIGITYYFDRYAHETQIDPSKVSAAYDTGSELYKRYTSPDALVPSDDPSVVAAAAAAVGSESNPYLKAQDLYLALLGRLAFSAAPSAAAPLDSLQSGSADSYAYALLFAAFARSVGVPTRPVAGYLVYGDKQTVRHYWDEFYLPGFGWVPVDPTLGSGAKFGDFPTVQDPRTYYFGNIDNQHIAFSRGVIDVQPLDPNGKTVRKDRMFSLQTIHEEASSGVRSYSSFWQDVQIIDWW